MRPLESYYDGSLEEAGRCSRWFNTLFCAVARVVLKPLFRYRFYDVEHLRQVSSKTPYIFAANHFSNLDPVFVMLSLRPRRIRFIGKEELFRNPLIARMGALVGGFPVKRGTADRTAIRRAVTILKRGECLGIFPEGTRVRPSEQDTESREGIALIAQMSKAQVIPVRIWGTDEIKPPGTRGLRFPRVVLRYGKPIDIEEFAHIPKSERFAAFTEEV
ncbi:MAG: 1-acyl-sn-glycerol-3-phosphate acyltransferase, partial [Coriobacteriaceae bacterium]|nr:1-acyl-sn-glycerol-3-phosphate acyltransferase [Coriobacteriaceae bacterium]